MTHASATTPYQVPTSVRNGWNHTYGLKLYSTTSEKKIVYDVYNNKYTHGGYAIVNKNFGKGTQPYLTFQGWAVLFGYHNEYSWNNSTYIVAQKSTGDSGVGTTRIYSTKNININATTDLEYNNTGHGLYNPCNDSQYNKDNQYGCNMRYKDVGFNAYIPLKDLFPKKYEKASWEFYIVKDVCGHMVYTKLKVPFNFSSKTYQQGKVSLSSGINASHLMMIGTDVTRRSYVDEPASYIGNRYFQPGKTYSMVKAIENSTAIWFGVRTPKDGYATRYAASPYWQFKGSQVTLNYYPPPEHISTSVSSPYHDGATYWAKPGDQVYIYDKDKSETGNKYMYLRLYGSGQDIRSNHHFDESKYSNHPFFTSSHAQINSAYREENGVYGEVRWGVVPHVSGEGDAYKIEYYYKDIKGNHTPDYGFSGFTLRIDGKPPSYKPTYITGVRYVNGHNYWVRPGDVFYIQTNSYETQSGHKAMYLRLVGNGNDDRAYHDWHHSDSWIDEWYHGKYTDILSGHSPYFGWTAEYQWRVQTKSNSNGKSFNVDTYFRDNVGNHSNGYIDSGENIDVDGTAPSVSFSPNSSGWTKPNLNVGVKVSDSLSGVYRFRYQVQHGSTWSSYSEWINGTQKTISLSHQGRNRIQVEAEDHVGNIRNQYSGYYYIDTAPIAKFHFNPPSVYEGDSLKIINDSTDPDGNQMTAYWTLTAPNGQVTHQSTWDAQIPHTKPGTYQVRLKVTDSYGRSSTVSKAITVHVLAIQGFVKHTTGWTKLHTSAGDPPNAFYSGETFLLSSQVTNHPIQSVQAEFIGDQINGKQIDLTKNLTADPFPTYVGQLYDPRFSDPQQLLSKGTDYFQFTATWKNGTVKSCLVPVQIIGNVYQVFLYHRTS